MCTLLRTALFLGAMLLLPACSGSPSVTVAPPDFVMSTPGNEAIGVAGTPSFTWSPSIGATSYTVQVSTDSSFSPLLVDQSGLTTTSFSPATPLQPGTVYFWRVTSVTPSGDIPATGTPFHFTTIAPVPGEFSMISPEDSAIGLSTRPTFTWNPSLGAGSYRLQVSTDGGFGTFQVDESGLQTTSFTLTVELAPSTTYFWRVQAVSDTVVIADDAPRTFMTAVGPAPGPFTLTSPGGGSIGVSTTPTYVWTASSGATSYRLQVARDDSFQFIVVDQAGITTTSVTPTTVLQLQTIYFWRVTAENDSGTTTPTVSPIFFTTV